MAENCIQNWDLADAILEQLYNCRRNRVLFDDLRNRLPQFTNIREEELIEVLRGLSEASLADVAPISSGFQGKWGAIVNAGISSQGDREVADLRAVEACGEARFQNWSEQLYADLDRAGANLRKEYAHRGLLASSSYYRAAVRLILDRLRGLEEAFVTGYLRVVQERTTEGVAGLRERWLRRKIESIWKREVDRAKLNASRLCGVSGVSPDQYAPQITELELEADALRRSLLRKLEIAAIEHKLPVVKPETVTIDHKPSVTKPRVIILTALSIEYKAVRSHLSNLREETHPQGTVYEVGEFAGQDTTWEVCVVETGAGNDSAALEAERAISYFNPQIALFVGVAGGLIDDVALGDVVAATQIYGYESGKADRDFHSRSDVGNSSYDMTQRARAEAKREDWMIRLGAVATGRPKVLVKPIAAGEKVVASRRSAVFQFLRSNYGDAVAVEMEGRGFLEATHANPNVRSLVVRGISDLIDRKSDADAHGCQELAAEMQVPSLSKSSQN